MAALTVTRTSTNSTHTAANFTRSADGPLPIGFKNKLGLIGGETQPQYPQYPQYMPPPPPQQQAQAPAAGTSSLADDGSVGNKEQHGAV
ncbi:unnamed protein product [Ceratitis capitata]|uniref:(Mediterranean fruit fly) hypothetical protein n=1 Tax=Ceratitis capitata TaxID=7213 RepID=A0A811UT76_CERCA|nr:unnamed protein product [Ceratitis capitata]